MKSNAKNKIANSLGSNQQLNKTILDMKSSWDKVGSMLSNTSLPRKKPKK
jgi:hypothetical protein